MAAMAGRAIRIGYDAGSGAVAIVGSTADNFEITKEGISIVDKDDDGVQTFLDDTIGTWAMSGGVEGVLKDATILGLMDSSDNFTFDMEVVVGALGTFSGKFAITNFSVNGPDGTEAATFTFQIASSGAITFA